MSDVRMEQQMDRQIRALLAIMRTLLQAVVVKRELSQRARLSVHWFIYVSIATCGHTIWIGTERMRLQIQEMQKINFFLSMIGQKCDAAPPHQDKLRQLKCFGHQIEIKYPLWPGNTLELPWNLDAWVFLPGPVESTNRHWIRGIK